MNLLEALNIFFVKDLAKNLSSHQNLPSCYLNTYILCQKYHYNFLLILEYEISQKNPVFLFQKPETRVSGNHSEFETLLLILPVVLPDKNFEFTSLSPNRK